MAATHTLLPSMTAIAWQHAGTAPEFWRVSFECSTNGFDWNYLGDAMPGTNQWTLSGLSLPLRALVRARGFVQTGTSTWFLESTEPVGPETTTRILRDKHLGFASGAFGFRVVGPLGRPVTIEVSADLVDWTPMQTNVIPDAGYFDFTAPLRPPRSASF